MNTEVIEVLEQEIQQILADFKTARPDTVQALHREMVRFIERSQENLKAVNDAVNTFSDAIDFESTDQIPNPTKDNHPELFKQEEKDGITEPAQPSDSTAQQS